MPQHTEPCRVFLNERIKTEEVNHGHQTVQSKEDLKTLYPNIFNGIGKFPGEPYTITLDPNVRPRQMPHRPVPVHLEAQLSQQMQEMTDSGVIKKVEPHEFTLWISSYILVETTDKEGKP